MIPLWTRATRPVRAEVGVGVDVGRRAVGGPAGVADAGRRRRERARRRAPSRGWRACRRACATRCAPSVHQRDPGGVVAAVLQPPQALDDDVLSLLVADVPHDAAHGPESIGAAGGDPGRARRGPRTGTMPAMPNGVQGRRAVPVRRARPRRLGRAGRALPPAAVGRGDHPAARPRRPARPRGGAAGLPPALPAAQPAGQGRPAAAPQAGGVPAPAAAAAHAVRDRAGGLGRRRQVDHRARAPADAGPLGRAPQRRAGHHRRLPLPQRRARAPRASCSARGSPSPTTGGRCCASSSTSSRARTRSRRRPTPTSCTTWCPTTRSWCGTPTS